MQISLRSQMIAGTTALVGATAIAMTPMAPAVSIPSLSVAKMNVAMAAFENPLAALVGTGNMALNYLLNGNYSTTGTGAGLTNWGPYSNLGPGLVLPNGTVVVDNGAIGPVTNTGLTFGLLPDGSGSYGPSINAVGLIPDFLAQPFPILTQVVNNQLGYLNNALQAVNAVVGAGVNLLWSPVQLAVTVSALVLSGNIALIPAAVTEIVTGVVTGFQVAVGEVVSQAQTIVGNLVAKASAVVNTIIAEAPLLIEAVQGQAAIVANSVQTTIAGVSAALAAGDIQGTWNALVNGLLGPSGIPGTLVNLTLGAGVQVSPDIAPTTPGTLVPSTRVLVETTGQALTGALKQTAPAPASAVRSAAAAKKAAAPVAAVATADTEAASSEAAPAPAKATAKAGRHAARAAK